MSYINAGGTVGYSGSFIFGGTVAVVVGFTFTYDLSAAGGNGLLNLIMFG